MKAKNLLRNTPALKTIGDDELSSVSGGARASFSDLSILKVIDKASPSLFKACCSGSHFPTAMLTV